MNKIFQFFWKKKFAKNTRSVHFFYAIRSLTFPYWRAWTLILFLYLVSGWFASRFPRSAGCPQTTPKRSAEHEHRRAGGRRVCGQASLAVGNIGRANPPKKKTHACVCIISIGHQQVGWRGGAGVLWCRARLHSVTKSATLLWQTSWPCLGGKPPKTPRNQEAKCQNHIE